MAGYLDMQNVSISGNEEELKVLMEKQVQIHISRFSLAVFVAYLLPGLASTAGVWTNIAALTISLATHMSVELYVVMEKAKAKDVTQANLIWFTTYNACGISTILGMVSLLFWAISCGRFIEDSLSSRIPIILSENSNAQAKSWKTFKEAMLRSWIIARVCQPEYVLARTPFNAGLGIGVTGCVVTLGAKAILLRSIMKGGFPLFIVKCNFIIGVWIVIHYRWFSAVLYFQRTNSPSNRLSQLKDRSVELYKVFGAFLVRYVQLFDICYLIVWDWTRRIIKPKVNNILRCASPSAFFIAIICIVLLVCAIPLIFLGMLICTALVLVCVMQILSIFCVCWLSLFGWLVSGWVFDTKFMSRLCKVDRDLWDSASRDKDFLTYKAALERVCLPGEDAISLWVANRNTFHQSKGRMDKAYQRGKSCKELITVIGSKVAENNSESSFVNQLLEPIRGVEEYFPLLKQPFWRMTALSLLQITTEVFNQDSFVAAGGDDVFMQNAITAYKKAQDLMDLVDCPDNVDITVDVFGTSNVEAFVVRSVAERTMDVNSWHKKWKTNRSAQLSSPEEVEKSIRTMYEIAKKNLENMHLLGDVLNARALCTNWRSAARSYSVYKVCKIILDDPPSTVEEFVDVLHNFFADVMVRCLADLPEVVMKSSRKWAAEFKEQKISAAIEMAAFALGVMDEARKSTQDDTQYPDTSDIDVEGKNM